MCLSENTHTHTLPPTDFLSVCLSKDHTPGPATLRFRVRRNLGKRKTGMR